MELDLKSKRQLIKKLNTITFWGLKGIKAGDVLSTTLWHISGWTKENVCDISIRISESFTQQKSIKNPAYAFIYSHSHLNRKDHLAQFRAVENLFEDKLTIHASEEKSNRPRWNPYILLLPIWQMQMRHLNCPNYIKKGLRRQLCRAAAYADEMLRMIKHHASVKKLIFFFDVLEIDNILVQKCNKLNYMTYTLEHGIVNGSYDYVDYKCSHAKCLLLWGEFSKQTARQCCVAESRIKLTGNLNSLLKNPTIIHTQKQVDHIHRFIVCLSGVITKGDWQKNKELIEIADFIADKYSVPYILKIHPADKMTHYLSFINQNHCTKIFDKRTSLQDLLGDVDFLLCGNSTTFGDAIYNEIPAFRYIPDKDLAVDVCRGVSWGRAGNLQNMNKLLEEMLSSPDAYMAQLLEVKRFLYGDGEPAKQYYKAITENI